MELGWEVVRNCGGQRGGLSLDTMTWVCLGPDSPLNGTLPELFPQMHTVLLSIRNEGSGRLWTQQSPTFRCAEGVSAH